MTAEHIDLAKQAYARGQIAFERGSYRESIEALEKAAALAKAATPLGGEIQIWLVNAYAAAERQADALALCEVLNRHPSYEVRKQAKNLLYILKAPRLKLKAEWKSQIPDLADIAEGETKPGSYTAPSKKPPRRKPEVVDDTPIDWSQINTRDNAFVWVALVGVVLVLLGLWWLA